MFFIIEISNNPLKMIKFFLKLTELLHSISLLGSKAILIRIHSQHLKQRKKLRIPFSNLRIMVRFWKRWDGQKIRSPSLRNPTIFDENLIVIEINKLEHIITRTIYVGATIQDVTKITMYEFLYNYIVKEFSVDEVEVFHMIWELK